MNLPVFFVAIVFYEAVLTFPEETFCDAEVKKLFCFVLILRGSNCLHIDLSNYSWDHNRIIKEINKKWKKDIFFCRDVQNNN